MTTNLTLNGHYQAIYDVAERTAAGVAPWRERKKIEAKRLLALAERAGDQRMDVLIMNLSADFRAVVRLIVPVPMEPGPDGVLHTGPAAVLGIQYPRMALTVPVPGFSFVSLLEPGRGAFHPNIGRVRGQLCLGNELPPGIPVTELVLLSYGLLSLQSIMLDPDDPLGVMNAEAARWWQCHTNQIPLSREAFLMPAAKGGSS